MTAFDRLIDALRDAGRNVIPSGDKATAQCPAHDDNHASLSISRRRDGKGVVVHCHADCQTADIVAALGWSMRDLFDEPRMRAAYNVRNTYIYPDGRKVYRKPGKKFHQSGNTKGASLFHADKIGDACLVYVPEGEKDVLAIEAAGGTAMCAAMGAGKARLADWSVLAGLDVVVVADNDEPGRKHARDIVGLLDGKARSVRVVQAAVGKDVADHIAAGYALHELVPVEPPEPVDGAELLDDVEHFTGRFLTLPTTHHLVTIVLWVMHTWAIEAFYTTPRLVLDSPEPESGKTRVLEVIRLLCRAARLIVSTSPAALYRRIDSGGARPVAVLQDEADAIWSRNAGAQAEDLRALYDNGYRRGATVDRCVGEGKNIVAREFNVFAPVALAGLAGRIPRTVITRAVVMHMRRRAPDEHVDDFRERDADTEAAPLRERIEAWTDIHTEALGAARPAMPEGVRDRRAEVWEALLAVADRAGGDWPQRAREACRHFEFDTDPDELSFGARLLRDMRTVFGDHDRMFSVDIVSELTSDPEAEWADLWGKPLNQARLAKELKRYGVRSNTIRIGEGRAKGYQVDGDDGLGQAWHAYLPTPRRDTRDSRDIAGQRVTPPNASRDSRDNVTASRDSRDIGVTPKTTYDQGLFENVTRVTPVTPIGGRPASSDANAAYHAGLCRDGCGRPASAGRPRCDECHRIWQTTIDGYDR